MSSDEEEGIVTMDDMWGDSSEHRACPNCGMCVDCGDCRGSTECVMDKEEDN